MTGDWFKLSGCCADCGGRTDTMYEVEGYTGVRILFCEDCFGGEEDEDELVDVLPIR